MKLSYQIVADDSALKRVFRSIETEARASQRRQTAIEASGAKARVNVEREAARKQIAEAKAAERAKVSAARAQQREVQRVDRYWEQQKARHHANELRRIDREKAARITAAHAAARAETLARKRTVARITGGAGRAVTGAAVVGGALTTAIATNAVSRRVGLDNQFRQIANQGFDAKDGRSRADLYKEARTKVDDIAGRTGTNPEALSGAIGTVMAKTGDFDTAIGSLEELNKLAMATGSSLEDLGATYGSAVSSLKRGGASTEQAIAQALELSRVFAGQAKFGEIEVSDLASQGGKIIGAATMFAGDRSRNLTDMGALTQMAAQGGATSAEDATTAVKNFVSDAVKKGDKLGVNVWADSSKTKLRGADEIMADAMEKSGGNLEKLLDTFGEQSRSILNPNIDKFREAGGGKAGREAVLAGFQAFRDQVLSQQEVDQSAAFAADSPAAKFAASLNRLNEQIGEKLLPKLPPLIDAIGKLTPHVTKLAEGAAMAAEWLAENPFTGMSTVLAGYIGAEIAAAKIGDAIKNAITGSAGGVDLGGADGGGSKKKRGGRKPKKVGMLGKAGAAVTGGVFLAAALDALDFADDMATSDDKGKTFADKFSFARAPLDALAPVAGSLPIIGPAVQGMNMSNQVARWVDPEAAEGAQGSGLKEVLSALLTKLDEIKPKEPITPRNTVTDISAASSASIANAIVSALSRHSPVGSR